jgi:hypothetical protein
VAIAIDATNTPAGVSQTNGATTTVVTASFTPPSGTLVLVCWAGNSQSGANPTDPSVTSSVGLSFTTVGIETRTDSGAEGQAAMWWALGGGASTTVTVTNNATSGNRHARLQVVVLTGVDTGNPTVSVGQGSDGTGGLDNCTYTSAADNSMGWAAVSDWDVASTTFTAAAGTTIVDSASPGNSVNGATLRQTTPTTSGASVSLSLTSPTSTTWNWVRAEIREGTAADPYRLRVVTAPSPAATQASTW